MSDRFWQRAHQTQQGARGDLTNGPTYYSLMVAENNKANCAACVNTPHSSNPTLISPVTGLHGIIANRGTSVLRGCLSVAEDGGPTDSTVGLGRFAVLRAGKV